MARIPFTLYSIITGAPVAGLTVDLPVFKRINVDDTVIDLTPPLVEDDGDGVYHAVVDPALLLPGSLIRYVVRYTQNDAGGNPITQYLDGELDASTVGASTFGAVNLDNGIELVLTKGDRAPSLVYTLRDATGAAVDLSSGTPAVEFFMRSDQGGDLVIDGGAVDIVDAAAGQVMFAWPAEASQVSGNFLAQFVLTQGALESTYPYARQLVVRVVDRV